jgi:hypothetical protein
MISKAKFYSKVNRNIYKSEMNKTNFSTSIFLNQYHANNNTNTSYKSSNIKFNSLCEKNLLVYIHIIQRKSIDKELLWR